jgi:hypothetical protein
MSVKKVTDEALVVLARRHPSPSLQEHGDGRHGRQSHPAKFR